MVWRMIVRKNKIGYYAVEIVTWNRIYLHFLVFAFAQLFIHNSLLSIFKIPDHDGVGIVVESTSI